jgi:predicted permease
MAPAGILTSFLAAIQASLSVLLVISYGAIAARFKLLDGSSSKSISKVCVQIFLPALLLTKIGSELHSGSASRYGILLIWAFVCHFASFLIGITAHLVFKMPDWVTAALMFNNTTSYPLLLIQSLDETGILTALITTDESTRDAIERAKSYFLVAVGPRLMDSEHAPEPSDDKSDLGDEDEPTNPGWRNGIESDEPATEQSTLLHQHRHARRESRFFPSQPRESSVSKVMDRRPSIVPRRKWIQLGERTKWWLLFLSDFLNAPLLGAILGAIIGLVPALHVAFFADTLDGGIFSAWLTSSLKNVGGLFVPLPVVVAGVSLYLSAQKARAGDGGNGTPWVTTAFILVIRFVIWPVVSIAVVYGLAKNTNVLGTDPVSTLSQISSLSLVVNLRVV